MDYTARLEQLRRDAIELQNQSTRTMAIAEVAYETARERYLRGTLDDKTMQTCADIHVESKRIHAQNLDVVAKVLVQIKTVSA